MKRSQEIYHIDVPYLGLLSERTIFDLQREMGKYSS